MNNNQLFSTLKPTKTTYMNNYVGGFDQNDNSKYIQKQTDIIDSNNQELYKRKIVNSDNINQFNPVSHFTDLTNNYADRGYDYREFPEEVSKEKKRFDPYIQYMHSKGLIGKNKYIYKTNYINIDSNHRKKNTVVKIEKSIVLDNDPLLFNSQLLRIYMSDTSLFSLNDKITISGIDTNQIIVRSRTTDNLGNIINYFSMNEGKQYMEILANNNMNINSSFTSEIKDLYTDMKIVFDGFVGDKQTKWYFDTRIYQWEFTDVLFNNKSVKNLLLTENVYGVTSATANLPESDQINRPLKIAEMKIDKYGNVVDITPINDIIFDIENILWTEPSSMSGSGTVPTTAPSNYFVDAVTGLTQNGLNTLPTLPASIYTVMEYFEKVQNVLRPIFYNHMNTSVINFNLRYQENNKIYQDVVRIIIPEKTVITTLSSIGNISLNLLNSNHRMYLTSADVEKSLNIYDYANNSISTDTPTSNKFYIKLDKPYIKKQFSFTNPLLSGALEITVFDEIGSDITIKYFHYGGISLNNLNANYVVQENNTNGFKYIKQIVNNSYIVVEINNIGYYVNRFGGDNITIGLIQNINSGYSNPNSYVIDLEKVYTNIVSVKIINSIFPITQKNIRDGITGGNKNNIFYWQNLDDGNIVYSITLDSGNYTIETLKTTFELLVQNVMRSTNRKNIIYLDINQSTDKVIFSSYNEYIPYDTNIYSQKKKISEINMLCSSIINSSNVPQPILQPNEIYYKYPDGDYFKKFPNRILSCDSYRITIYHPNHNVQIGDEIIISDSTNYEDIPAIFLNTKHIVVRIEHNYYDILVDNINLDNTLNMSNRGGNEIKIYTPNIFRIRFDYNDTFGSILGFRNIGQETSITPYQHVITNDILYENENINFVLQQITGKTIDSYNIDLTKIPLRNALNFSGPPYLLIECKELKNSVNLGSIKDYFYKINLKEHRNSKAYDTFVNSPLYYNEPIESLQQLSINIYTPDGQYYDSNRIDHSFVIELITFDEIPIGSNIRS